uniref:PLA2c domain-containing protein n=1 Tax=Gasterosteus aculeatus aculeatus TaxID=481459 RepID=A0AAQ4PRZ5_GASAC
MGSLYQMEKDGLLDSLLYLGGVSGSTWSMSSIYDDPQWSTSMDKAVSRLSGPGVKLEDALAWLGERAKEEHFSLSDIWGVLTSAGIMKQMNKRHLSDEASRNATNPYPIYNAIEKHCFSHGPTEGKWFENGELLEKKPEMDMIKLQGVLGSAMAHEDTIRGLVPPWLNVSGHVDGAAEDYLRVYNALEKLVALTRSTIKDPEALSDLDELQQILGDKLKHNESAWLEPEGSEQRRSVFQQSSEELLASVATWSESLKDGAFKTHVSLLTKKVLPKIMTWEWGTTRNFLFQYQDSVVPTCLQSHERFHLIDAGLMINAPYPSFLGEKRDIDLIIAPEYSAGTMFETLTFARDYAAEMQKPFPQIDDRILQERDWPKDCYVFEGKENEASIVYMPLFNRRNCKDAEEVKAKMEEFSTFQGPFSQEKMEFVMETAKANMKNNKETLLEQIHKAVLHRQRKS